MTSRLPHASPAWHAELQLRFARSGERIVLRENRHFGPLRVQKALYPEGDAVCQTILLHPPSGIAGGDQLQIRAAVENGAHAQLTTPGAGKWYRSAGADAGQQIELSVGDGATLEWLPQESIVFDGARAHMRTRVSLAADSRFIGWDVLCLGRAASGERFSSGRFDLFYRIDRDGTPLWIERGRFDGSDPMLASPAGWDGAGVCATLLATGPLFVIAASVLFLGSFVLGATTLEEFGLALFLGLLSGAYSSIFIATPLLAILKEREPRYRELRARLAGRGPAEGELVAAGAAATSGGSVDPSTAVAPRPRKKAKKR